MEDFLEITDSKGTVLIRKSAVYAVRITDTEVNIGLGNYPVSISLDEWKRIEVAICGRGRESHPTDGKS